MGGKQESGARFDGAALGTRIKLLRELRDMTLQAVADTSGLTKSHVWELEQGKSVNPTVNAIWGLSAALTVSPAQLLGLDDKVPSIDPVALRIAGIVDREIKKAVAKALSPSGDKGLPREHVSQEWFGKALTAREALPNPLDGDNG